MNVISESNPTKIDNDNDSHHFEGRRMARSKEEENMLRGGKNPNSFSFTSASGGAKKRRPLSSPLQQSHRSLTWHRRHSSEHASIRRTIHEMEQSTRRVRTGWIDPAKFDLVRYQKHPMEAWAQSYRRRMAQISEETGGDDEQTHKTYWDEVRRLGGHNVKGPERDLGGEESSPFKPLRIVYHTDEMELADAPQEKIDFVKEVILPRAAEFWSQSLSVIPVEGFLRMDSSELVGGGRYCGDSEFTAVPSSHMSTGVPDADLVLYVSATPSTRFCGANTLAVAVSCNHDGYDRPVAGAINVCLDTIELLEDGTADEATILDNLDVVVHEIGHVLAMSSNHFTHFRDSDGSPRTSRSWRSELVECVTGDERSVVMPSADTLGFFADDSGVRYAAITTERVRTVARNHFDCQLLPGAKLENQPTGVSCFGDHWDEKFGYSSTMSGVIAPTDNFMTPATLALCEDSGWYSANYSMSKISPWGHGAGCDFVNKPCLETDDDGEVTVPEYGKGFFCSKGSERGCSPAHTHKMACTVIDWDLYFPAVPPPESFRYFSEEPGKGGPKQADYCPVYGSTYRDLSAKELDCRQESNEDYINFYGEYFGANSMCFETSTDSGRCFKAQCIISERVLKVQLNGIWVTCEEDFQKLEITTAGGLLGGTLTCPRLSQVCPDLFCPVNCAGRGTCDFSHEVNGTIQPKCNCFDESDNSVACSQSLVLTGNYVDDSTDLVDVVTTSFFDPLVSVFTDHPDTWSTESWGWASGLFVLFLLMLLCICSSFWPKKKKTVRRYV